MWQEALQGWSSWSKSKRRAGRDIVRYRSLEIVKVGEADGLIGRHIPRAFWIQRASMADCDAKVKVLLSR